MVLSYPCPCSGLQFLGPVDDIWWDIIWDDSKHMILNSCYSWEMLVVLLAHLKSRCISDILMLYLEMFLDKMF